MSMSYLARRAIPMLVCNFRADFPPTCQRKFVHRLRTWRLRDPEAQLEYHVAFITRRPEPMLAAVWRKICVKWQSSLLKATEIVCTITKKNTSGTKGDPVVKCNSRQCSRGTAEMLESRKNPGSKEEYQKAKRLAKHPVHLAKSQAEAEVLKDLSSSRTDLFCLINQMRCGLLDFQAKKAVHNCAEGLYLDSRAWWVKKLDPTFRCKRCTGRATPVDGRQIAEVTVGRKYLQVVPLFCYLGHWSSIGGCGELASMTTRYRAAWTN